jgi:hypothetical protein
MGMTCNTREINEKYIQNFRKPKGTVPLVRPRQVNNIKMDLVEIGCKGVDWIQLAQDRVHCNESSCSIKAGEFLD